MASSSREWIVGCAAVLGALAPARAETVVRVGGTGSATGTAQLLAAAFMKQHPEVRVEVLAAMGSSGGIAALLDGKLDLALSNRLPAARDVEKAGLQARPYASTPFVIAVGPTVKATQLSSAQLAALYAPAGQYPDGQRARPVLRLSDATDTELVKSIAPEVGAALEQASRRPGMLDASTDSAAADLIERTPGGFGASTLALILSERRALRPLALNGVTPSVDSLEAGHWTLSKKMFYVLGAQPSAATRRFADYLHSDAARQLLAATGHSTR